MSEIPIPVATRPWREVLRFALKALITAALLYWLIRSDTLEFGKVKLLVSSAEIFLVTALTWLFVAVGLSTVRWLCILRIDGTRLGVFRGAALQTMALFFNSLLPGNLGGDFIKNHAVVRGPGGRLLGLVMVERLIGLITLVWAAAIGLFSRGNRIFSDPSLFHLALAIALLLVGSLLGPWVVFRLVRESEERGENLALGTSGGARAFLRRHLSSAADVIRLLRQEPRWLATTMGVSFAMHLCNIAYFLYLTRLLGNPGASFGDVATVFPVGMLSFAVPISISGLGVGHVLFDALFSILHLEGGATIFNVYMFAYLVPCTLGAIPFIVMRSRPRDANLPKPSNAT